MAAHYFLFLWSLMVIRLSAKVIDLSHNHGPDTFMSPGQPNYNRTTLHFGEYVPGVYVENGQYFSGEHGGTHMDAPAHFTRGGQTLHEVPLEATIADGVMIDCTEEVAKHGKTYVLPLQKLLDWEEKHGQIPSDAAVIINFNWSSKFDNPALYRGSEIDDQFQFSFPTLSPEAGIWLYEKRNIKLLAVDTCTPDPFLTTGNPFPIHVKYLTNNRLIIENLNGVGRLPPKGFRFHAAPVKYVGATGAQVRAYAMTYDDEIKNGAFYLCTNRSFSIVMLSIISVIMASKI